ncbi:MAG TPA: hypothetical protein VKM55_22125 [Candidatus Lokiarchaeia archaeon]|nr:hypothetical protein [Candidatus Lokiarchaeia archaeon]
MAQILIQFNPAEFNYNLDDFDFPTYIPVLWQNRVMIGELQRSGESVFRTGTDSAGNSSCSELRADGRLTITTNAIFLQEDRTEYSAQFYYEIILRILESLLLFKKCQSNPPITIIIQGTDLENVVLDGKHYIDYHQLENEEFTLQSYSHCDCEIFLALIHNWMEQMGIERNMLNILQYNYATDIQNLIMRIAEESPF